MAGAITDFIATGPFAAVYVFLVLVVALRSTATYGIGRYAHYLVMRARQPSSGFERRAWNWAHARSTVKATERLHKVGLIAIPLAFLTVGVQSIIVLAAGVIGLSLPRFVVAAFPGWLAWAAIYSTIGFAVWEAAIRASAGSPWGISILVILACSAAAFLAFRHKKPGRPTTAEDLEADS